jgi:hypothetical protein
VIWLFVAYGGGHAKALLPVARLVQAQGLAQVVFLALTTAAGPVREAGLPTIGFADLLEGSDAQALRHGERLLDSLSVQAASREESVAYLGLSYAELEADVGVQAAADRYRQYGRQAFLPVRVLERALHRWQPACVLTTNRALNALRCWPPGAWVFPVCACLIFLACGSASGWCGPITPMRCVCSIRRWPLA